LTRGIRRARPLVPALLAVGLLLAGCSAAPGPAPSARSTGSATPTAAETPSPTPTAAATPTKPLTRAQQAAAIVAAMTPDERAGQVLMTAGTAQELPGLAADVRRYHLAGVMVRGRSAAGTGAVATAFAAVKAAAPDGLPLLTATDQEGGTVQVLSGPGFGAIPSAVDQGHGASAAERTDAAQWGGQLAQAGVNLDLAPVADVPCAATLHDNPPIADLDRQYSSDPSTAGTHVAAFVRGMRDAGVASTVKHFPGLGCVRQNTDTDTHVVDTVTTADSSRIRSFAAGIDAGAGFVMVSSAEYSKIDAGTPALFSSKIVQVVLRGRLGFSGVVVSDDVGGAAALKAWTPAQRVVKFVGAGGDLMLDIVPGDIPAMHAAVVQEASTDPAFAKTLTTAAQRVVAARLAAPH
jgi:beta-N-acetylhexosaminidase